MELDSLIYRHFTKKLLSCDENADVYSLFEWKTVDVLIENRETGETVVDLRGLEFPAHYSQTACDIIAGRYFVKSAGEKRETSMKQAAHRLASFWVDAMYDAVIITEGHKQIIYDELVYMLLAQIFAPNSPQWFNAGVEKPGGLKPGEAGYYFNEELGEVCSVTDKDARAQGSACFILSARDSLIGDKSLSDLMATETKLFKYGSGTGTNWSCIRTKGETLSGGGQSSGLISFLKAFDRNAGAIKSGGVTRRAAKMNILNEDHPEIMDFIRWKAEEEDKAVALGQMGYSLAFGGEAYETVSGQNVNNTVRVTDDFMNAAANEYFQSKHSDGNESAKAGIRLSGRVDSSVDREVSVSEVFDNIASAAWRCGDPGLQFDGAINAWHTCPAGSDGQHDAAHNRINASNPCSEYLFLDDSACNLASINVLKFYDENSGVFDVTAYLHAIKLAMLVLEATIHFGHFPTADVAVNTYKFRTAGLGMANLGALLMTMALPYDSDEARNFSAALLSLATGQAYCVSSLMAEKTGPFEGYGVNIEYMKKVLRNHARAASVFTPNNDFGPDFEGLDYKPSVIDREALKDMGFDNISEALADVWGGALAFGKFFGYRNAQVTCVAPTGTISLAMDCASTSIEPFYSHVTYKNLTGGGTLEMVNPAVPAALKRLGYAENEIREITGYILRNGAENAPYLKEEHYPVFDTVGGSGTRFISPEGHVRMLGALAPHVSGGISKTVNLRHEATKDDIAEIYILAWKLGVKAVSVYRDGSKGSQPLNVSLERDEAALRKPVRIKPTGIRKAKVHEANIAGSIKLYITTSFYEDGRLGEIYVSAGRQGSLIKGLLDSISTMISEMLQYGVDPKDIAKMYRGQKFEPSGFVSGHPYIKHVDSISDLISKIIDIELDNFEFCQIKPDGTDNSGYITNKELKTEPVRLYGETCPSCGSDNMVQSGVCKVCLRCGQTTGCS